MELPIVNHPDYVAKINDDNKFPIKKFGALAKYLLDQGVVKNFHIPKDCSIETMRLSHSLEYINHIINKTVDLKLQKKIGFPINDSVVRRSFVATGGTVLASKLALDSKLACNTAGGSHHATFDSGAGYCVFNDVAGINLQELFLALVDAKPYSASQSVTYHGWWEHGIGIGLIVPIMALYFLPRLANWKFLLFVIAIYDAEGQCICRDSGGSDAIVIFQVPLLYILLAPYGILHDYMLAR